MRSRFDEQLSQLHTKLIEMGSLCEDAISASISALEDGQGAERARLMEREIDRCEREIEHLCMKLLLQQQPVARDLRTISAALKMISDLERIGDQAADIGEITRHLNKDSLKDVEDLRLMAKAAGKMVTDSVDSFVKEDAELARLAQQEDDQVDALFIRVRSKLVEKIAREPDKGEECLDLLMIAKYLERIADHGVNVAEWVEYSITGIHPKE